MKVDERADKTCEHPAHEVNWYPATNEEGWRCSCGHKPGEPPGYDPERDCDQIEDKVQAMLMELIAASWICQANSTLSPGRTRSGVTEKFRASMATCTVTWSLTVLRSAAYPVSV